MEAPASPLHCQSLRKCLDPLKDQEGELDLTGRGYAGDRHRACRRPHEQCADVDKCLSLGRRTQLGRAHRVVQCLGRVVCGAEGPCPQLGLAENASQRAMHNHLAGLPSTLLF
jgi:hypothetical protein